MRQLFRLGTVCAVLATGSAAAATQPWVETPLPVLDGVECWFDASQIAGARKAKEQKPIDDGQSVDEWADGAAGLQLRQSDAAKQPTLQSVGEVRFVRFEGREQHLESDLRGDGAAGPTFRDLTVFIVAAPFHNEGTFPGMFGMHAKGKADYRTGINIDQGFSPTPKFETVNVEGAGCSGQKNLRTGADEFSRFHRVCVSSTPGKDGVKLYVDGKAEGMRDREESRIAADRLLLGGRYTGDAQGVRCFFAGDIAEVIVFNRVLGDDERQKIEDYLAAKYDAVGPLPKPIGAPGERRLVQVDSPPPVQMHVPGFTVRELPVQLSNINNVLYREDGALVALGYDGNIYVLRDKDGDGLEEEVKLFWKNEGQLRAPIGMALTPPGYKRGRGVFVPSKAKISLLLDADGDDQAEEEIVVAKGWPELWTQVDAIGVAVDPRDESIYFGLGTWNFANGYQTDDNGVAKYRLDDEHGTILRVSPDFSSREIVCTGTRFPVAMRFNKDGELFCTDQEGATWLANGNPFDELLHIQRGRHYGFPPRHPRHLPDVIDEPSVFDFRPQHQSTCGLNFNDPTSDGSIFGPEWWRSDALVTGFSRGKLYRTKLAQTENGYVAQNQLIGSTNMMPSDACVGPSGSLVVAMHSGGPDWGTGPAGEGKLYKATYHKSGPAIPSLAWQSSPREVRIAFDRAVAPEMLKQLAERTTIDGGEYVAAADRFELFRPGYAVVKQQRYIPRVGVEVQGLQLLPDQRTVILTTAPHAAAMNYSITMPGVVRQADDPKGNGVQPQLPDIDLQYDLSGVEVTWQPENGEPWTGWLPHLDLNVAKEFTKASAEHEALWQRMQTPGTLVLRTSLDLDDMLHPAVQPGEKLDWEPDVEEVTLTFSPKAAEANVTFAGKPGEWAKAGEANYRVQHTLTPKESALTPVEIRLRHAGGEKLPALGVSYHTNEDARARALSLRRFLLPWARRADASQAEMVENRELPELKGGNWLNGEKEFYGSVAGCSKCHMMRGVGGKIGPDLSNLPQRDYASVLRDVTQPSFAINPDFTSQTVLLKEGRVLAGTVRTEGEQVIVADTEGKETIVAKDDVEMMEHSPQSIMPEGIPKALGEERLRDLLTYLLVAPPTMPVYGELAPPPPRRMVEVEAVLQGSETTASTRPLHVVLVAGAKDHGPGEHDYPAWKKAWRELLEMSENVRVTTAEDWPSADDLKSADALVFFQKGTWTAERARDTDAFLKRGGGISYIHYAVDGGNDAAGFAERIGLAWQGGRSKFRHGPLDLQFSLESGHPIARNFDQVHFYDESYWQPVGDPQRITLLATGVEDGAPQPLFWTREHGGGRVFVSIPGHYSWTFDDPLFRILLLRGLAWTAGESVDRFNELALPGARVRAKIESQLSPD